MIALRLVRSAFLFAAVLLLVFEAVAQRTTTWRTVTVISEPNAAVWIDGVRYGITDDKGRLTIKTVSPGGHSVRVRADGFSEATKPLLAAQKGDFSIKLTKTSDQAELAFQEAERQSTNDRQKAAEAYRTSIKLKPKYVAAYIGLARVLSDAGDSEGALKVLADLKKVSPTNAEGSAIEGRIYNSINDEAKAVAAYKRAIVQGKGFQPEAYAGLGLLYKEKAEELGDDTNDPAIAKAYTEAIKNLAVAVKQLSGAPDAIVIYQLLGLMLEKQGKLKEAIATYEDFLKVFPDANEAEAVRSFIVQIKKQLSEQGQ